MAKSEKKPGKRKQAAEESRTDQVRSAVDQAFQAAGSQISRERAQEIADDLSAAAGRVRETLEELRPPTAEELRRLGERLDAIEKRLAVLERPAATRARTAAPKKPPATKAAARRPAAKKPAPGTAARRGTGGASG